MESHCTAYAEAGGRGYMKEERQAKMKNRFCENAGKRMLELVLMSRARTKPIKRKVILIEK